MLARLFLALALVALAPVPAAHADALEDEVARMARVGGCWSPSFSPDDHEIAFVSNLSGVPQAWIAGSQGGFPLQVTALPDPVGRVTWSPEGEWLALSVAPGGGMNQQVELVRPDGTELRRLTKGGKETNWLGGWSHDSKLLAFASNKRSPSSMDAYLYSLESKQTRLAARNPGIGSLTDVSRDGKRAVLFQMRSRGDDDLLLLDLASGGLTLLTPHTPPGSFEGGRLSPDGKTVYLSSNKDRDLAAFARIRIGDDGKPGPIEVLAARDDAGLEDFALTEDGTAAALLWNAAGRSELSFFDVASGSMTKGPRLPAEIASDLTFSADGRLLALTLSGAAAPANIWVVARDSGAYWRVTASPHPGVRLDRLIQPGLVHYKAKDGLDLTGWLYQPRGARRGAPFVLSFHGGPEGEERPRFRGVYQALLARGIGVFAPNVRGSAGFGKRFVNLDNGALRKGAIEDIAASVDYLVSQGFADPKRIGIMGGSYGGYMTMAGLAWYPDLFAAGADLYGVVNFETFFAHTEPWMAAISKVEYGDPDTQKDLLRELSPLNKVDQVKAPTIVLHGANDTNVPVVEAEQVVKSLKSRGIPVEYVLFPDEGHGFRKTANRITADVAVVRWFEKFLKPASGN